MTTSTISSIRNKIYYNRIYDDLSVIISDFYKASNPKIVKIPLSSMEKWRFDRKSIRHETGKFFHISGLECRSEDSPFQHSMPILFQDEIGVLGLIGRYYNNTLYFLIQLKIEPGNENYVQLSPTVQATKSNYTGAHGGKGVKFIDYFLTQKDDCTIVYDNVCSEGGNHFYQKRNRNVVVITSSHIEDQEGYIWLSLEEIKTLIEFDNLISFDLRSIVAGLTCFFDCETLKKKFMDSCCSNKPDRLNSYISDEAHLPMEILNRFANYQAIERREVDLYALSNWDFDDNTIHSSKYDYTIEGFHISIAGREVNEWSQPLVVRSARPKHVLYVCKTEEATLVLVRMVTSLASPYGKELTPSIEEDDIGVNRLYTDGLCGAKSAFLSEEGGRFFDVGSYYEIRYLKSPRQVEMTDGCFWISLLDVAHLLKYTGIISSTLRDALSLS